MAGNKGTQFQHDLLNYVLSGISFTPPDTLYIALFRLPFTKNAENLINSSLTISGANEVNHTNTSYVRMPYDSTVGNWDGSNGRKSNAVSITFPQATESWGTIKAWALMDVSGGGTGANIYYWFNLVDPVVIQTGDIVKFEVGDLVITEN